METKSSKRVTFWLSGLSVALISATQGLAIGIGESQVKSLLNQPLNISLPIQNANGKSFSPGSARATLASRQDHQRAGLQYPSILDKAQFLLFETADGRHSIMVSTEQPVQEPLLSFLVQLDWSHGRLLKEVSVLLDPPGFQQLPNVAPAPDRTLIASNSSRTSNQIASVVQTTQRTPQTIEMGSIDVPVFVQVDAALNVAPQRAASEVQPLNPGDSLTRNTTGIGRFNGNRYGPVRSGDTLMSIATAAARRSGGNAEILADEIYYSNPDAFLGSKNRLARGVYLQIPDSTASSSTPSRITANARPAATAGFAGISTISDFAFFLPPEEIKGEMIAAAEPENAPLPVTDRTTQQLDILPADEEATKVAQEIREQLENSAESVETTPSVPVVETAATNPEAAPSDASALMESDNNNLTSIPAASAQAEPEEAQTVATATETAASESINEGIRSEVEAGQLASVSAEESNDFMDTLLKWLPWVLLAFAVPAMLLMAFRRREIPAAEIPARHESTLDSTPPQRQDTISTYDEQHVSLEALTEDSEDEFENETVIIDQVSHQALIDEDTSVTQEAGTVETIIHAVEPASPAPADAFLNLDDHTLSDSDTQESIRPDFSEDPAEATTLLNRSDEDSSDEIDEELDAAQEAEIYLAYGQYMLAENNISRLRSAHPDNDRYKLLALKLFADTGRKEEMQHLSEDLLSRYTDESSGVHQQVLKICERAMSAEQYPEPVSMQATNIVAKVSPDEHGLEAADNDSSAVAESEPTQIIDPPPTREAFENISHSEATASADPVLDLQIDDPALGIDIELGDPDAETEHTPTRFSEDIEDYLHEHDKLPAAAETQDRLEDSLGALELSNELDLENDADIEYNELTEDELGAISLELDLIDNSPSTLEIQSEFGEQNAESNIENFTDTDYRLTALGRKSSETEASERLDIPFDLEMELEKLARSSKSLSGGE